MAVPPRRVISHLLLAAALLCAGRLARANAPEWSGLPFPWDGAGLVGTGRAEALPAGDVGFRLDFTYARRPLRIGATTALTDAFQARAALAVGLFRDRLQLGVVTPVSLHIYTPEGAALTTGAGQGTHYDIASDDLRLYFKASIVHTEIVRLAAAAALVAPSGDTKSFRSDGVWGGELRLLLDLHFRRVTLSFNLGSRLHGPFTASDGAGGGFDVGPELTWAAAVDVEAHRRFNLAAEAMGSESLSPGFTAAARTAAVALSGRVHVAPGFDLLVALARSVAPDAARTDDVRAVVGLAWRPGLAEAAAQRASFGGQPETTLPPPPSGSDDRDHDGIPDDRDACPTAAEDKDGFQDDDGCPDPDNDGDGIPDARDRCPDEPETKNGLDDDDGCPDAASLREPLSSAAVSPEPKAPFSAPALRFDRGAATSPGLAAWAKSAAQRIAAHPEIHHFRVEGHAFGEPRPLGEKRAAAAVKALVGAGVEAARLQPVGYGDSRPVDKKAPAANRRVELVPIEEGR